MGRDCDNSLANFPHYFQLLRLSSHLFLSHSLHVETVTRSAPNLNGLASETGSSVVNEALVSSSSTMASVSNNQVR